MLTKNLEIKFHAPIIIIALLELVLYIGTTCKSKNFFNSNNYCCVTIIIIINFRSLSQFYCCVYKLCGILFPNVCYHHNYYNHFHY